MQIIQIVHNATSFNQTHERQERLHCSLINVFVDFFYLNNVSLSNIIKVFLSFFSIFFVNKMMTK